MDDLHARGKCGIRASDFVPAAQQVIRILNVDVRKALTPVPDFLGDIRLDLQDGGRIDVEVKAQTTREYGSLASADWVRDETDFLRLLMISDRQFESRIPAWMKTRLRVDDEGEYFDGWTIEDLWLADVALLPDRERRRAAGINSPHDLHEYLRRKILVHVTRIGVQACRLADLTMVRHLMQGGTFEYRIFSPRASSAGIYVGKHPVKGKFEFAYYVAYRTTYRGEHVKGRHKLHARALPGVDEGMIRVDF
jgi:hypothetical protein